LSFSSTLTTEAFFTIPPGGAPRHKVFRDFSNFIGKISLNKKRRERRGTGQQQKPQVSLPGSDSEMKPLLNQIFSAKRVRKKRSKQS